MTTETNVAEALPRLRQLLEQLSRYDVEGYGEAGYYRLVLRKRGAWMQAAEVLGLLESLSAGGSAPLPQYEGANDEEVSGVRPTHHEDVLRQVPPRTLVGEREIAGGSAPRVEPPFTSCQCPAKYGEHCPLTLGECIAREEAIRDHRPLPAPRVEPLTELLDELDTLCQAVEGHRGGALTNAGLWHYHEKARATMRKYVVPPPEGGHHP